MPYSSKEKQRQYNRDRYEKIHGPIGQPKIRYCIICNLEMQVPKNSVRKYCSECWIIRNKEKALHHYKKESSRPARQRASLKQKEKYRDDPVYRLLSRTRNRAREENIEFNIDSSDIIIPEVCPVFKTPFQFGTYYTESLDRINNSKGYVKGNVQVLSFKANAMKNSATLEELIQFADWINNNKKEHN